jgi:hypothetical protein
MAGADCAAECRWGRHDGDPAAKPFTWTADPDAIIDKVRRGKQVLESIHSHVRHYQMQANEFVACEQALVLGSSRQGRRHGRRNDG